MDNTLRLQLRFTIHAPQSAVWEALTNPALIKKYFFGTETKTDWKKGSPITFEGVWEGQAYLDKGTILDIEPGKMVTYNYWSSFSGKEDVPENYANITYDLTEEQGQTVLTIIQDGIADQAALEHSQQNWTSVMNGMIAMVEAG